jgi:hypothetical protein
MKILMNVFCGICKRFLIFAAEKTKIHLNQKINNEKEQTIAKQCNWSVADDVLPLVWFS